MVIGVHKSRRPEESCNVATSFTTLVSAIENIFNYGPNSFNFSGPAKTLSDTEINELNSHGLRNTDNPYIFITRSSFFVTTLWFYRSNHGWYWTPKKPSSFEINDLNMCNWSTVNENFPTKAIGGYWNEKTPAYRNINLIKWLISTKLIYNI